MTMSASCETSGEGQANSRRIKGSVCRLGFATRGIRGGTGGRAGVIPPPWRVLVMSPDAIVVLKDDHKAVKKLFRAFEKAAKSGTPQTRGALVTQIIAELTRHTFIENEIMYPEVRNLLPDLEDDVLESYEEHHVADVLCLELSQMSPADEHFIAKTTVLIENVEHHVEEEETDWFPKVREGLSRTQLNEIGVRLLELKKTAPTNPSAPKAKKSAHDAVTA